MLHEEKVTWDRQKHAVRGAGRTLDRNRVCNGFSACLAWLAVSAGLCVYTPYEHEERRSC